MGVHDQSGADGRAPRSGLGHDPARMAARGGASRDRVVVRRLKVIATTLAAAAIAGGLLLMFALAMTTIAVPNPMVHRKEERAPVIRILGADGGLLWERGQAYDYMPIDLLPKHVIDAVVATEDRRFFQHYGLDPIGLARAMLANLRAGRYAQGGSTLTQQLAKNLFLTSERRLGRKFEELYLSLWLELRLSKKDILELYLNRVYFGGGAYGIEAAARRYFNKGARDLTVIEAAVLSGVLKAPSKFSPLSSPPLARQRARIVVQKMLAAGYLSDEQAKAASNEVIAFHNPVANREITGLETAIDYVLERLPPLSHGVASEILIETTIDGRLQKIAQQKLTALIAIEGEASQLNQGAMVVMEPDGAIKAMVGGKSYADSQYNRASRAKRQPGSTFKFFVYLAALESGLTPDTTVFDLPLTIKGWSPRNESGTYRGAMTLRNGLAQSVNSVAVRLLMDVGTKKTIEMAQRLGIRSELHDGPSLALGTSEVTLLEMTGAYATLANDGMRVEPHVIERVRTGGGVVLYQRPAKTVVRLLNEAQVGQMNDMLNAAMVNGTGRRAALDRYPAAGKTGTSQDFRDAWFIGFSSQFVGGVWFGNDNGRAMNKIMGGSLPARLWHDVMLAAHEGRLPKPLPGTSIAAQSSARVEPGKETPARSKSLETSVQAAAKPPRMPAERINEDFVTRALAASDGIAFGPLPSRSAQIAATPRGRDGPWPAPVWDGFDAADIAARISRIAPVDEPRVAPPVPAMPQRAPGMMSLGTGRSPE